VKFNLGKNTGLVHTFTDKNVINGVTYYYAVTAYDSGYASKGILPVESGKFKGKNLVSVMPTPRVPGYEDPQITIEHQSGYSTSRLKFNVLDPRVIEETHYEVFVDDSSFSKTAINIVNTTKGDTVVKNFTQLDGEPLLFDGMIGQIFDEPVITIIDSLSGWTEGSKGNLGLEFSLFRSGVRLPRDLEIRFFDHVADTSVLVSPQPINFQVWNTTENKQMDVIYFDKNNNDTVDVGDRIVPIVYVHGTPKGSWKVEFKQPGSGEAVNPQPGDAIKITIAKPFEGIDHYVIDTEPNKVNMEKAKKDFMENVAVIPNPYVVASSYEVPPPSVFSAGRGERRVYFVNLPPKCTIRIYTLAGELIREIKHEGTLLNGTEPWDLLSSEGLEISYGVYIYHVDAGQYGKKIGKFAIIK
jgi:hypothetical protein